jgi:hypothetical protein
VEVSDLGPGPGALKREVEPDEGIRHVDAAGPPAGVLGPIGVDGELMEASDERWVAELEASHIGPERPALGRSVERTVERDAAWGCT